MELFTAVAVALILLVLTIKMFYKTKPEGQSFLIKEIRNQSDRWYTRYMDSRAKVCSQAREISDLNKKLNPPKLIKFMIKFYDGDGICIEAHEKHQSKHDSDGLIFLKDNINIFEVRKSEIKSIERILE